MGFYANHILPVIIDKAMATSPIREARARVLSGLQGDVLEVGSGCGHNLEHYPSSVTSVDTVEPAEASIKRGAARLAAASMPVRMVAADAQRMDLPDARYEIVVSTWTLCSIPDPEAALSEIVRVMKPGGMLRFIEHGLAPDPKVVTWQRRIEPMWKRAAGGCHISREIDKLIEQAGLDVTDLTTYWFPKDPKIAGWTFEGTAIKR